MKHRSITFGFALDAFNKSCSLVSCDIRQLIVFENEHYPFKTVLKQF